MFRRLKDEDKLRAWGADPLTGIRHKNPPGYLRPTPTTSMRLVGSSLPPVKVEKSRVSYLGSLPTMKTPLAFPASKKLKKNALVPPSPPAPMRADIPGWLESVKTSRLTDVEPPPTEAPRRQRSKRKSRRSGPQSKDNEDPLVQKSASNPPVDPIKEATESPTTPIRQMKQRRILFRLFLQVMMLMIQHILQTFSQFLPAWKVLRNPKVTRGEFMDAWWTVWLAMVYFVALLACLMTAGKFDCFMVEGVNWVLGIVSLVMVFCIFSRCCLANGQTP